MFMTFGKSSSPGGKNLVKIGLAAAATPEQTPFPSTLAINAEIAIQATKYERR